jgi:hypothetical protein
MQETPEFITMNSADSSWNNKILIELLEYLEKHSSLFDSDFIEQLKSCNTLGRIWEFAVCKHLKDSCGLTVKKIQEFELGLTFANQEILIEATVKEMDFNKASVLTDTSLIKQQKEMEYLSKRVQAAVIKKHKDFQRKQKMVSDKAFLLALSFKANCLRIPDHYREFSYRGIIEVLNNLPAVSGVIVGWDWPYWFPEIAQAEIGAKINKLNDFCLILNPNAIHKVPQNLNLKCDRIII